MTAELLDRVREDLTRRREIPFQVKRHLNSVYGVSIDQIGAFFRGAFGQLEDYEVEQLFAPLFTPTLEDRARYSPLLAKAPIGEAGVAAIIAEVGRSPLPCALDVPGEPDFVFEVNDLLSSRYVKLLRLADGPSPEVVARLLRIIPADDAHQALALLRDGAWQSEAKQRWLQTYLDGVNGQAGFSLLKLDFLTDLVRDQVEVDSGHLLELTEKVLGEKRASFGVGGSSKPFFSRHIEEWHGHARDQRQFSEDEMERKQQALAMLADLVEELRTLAQASPS